MDYVLDKLIEEGKSLYVQQDFIDNHIADYEGKIKGLRKEKLLNEKAIKQVEEAIRKLER
jgi:hypothetical protein